jgi:hypothetical protein
VKGKQETLKSRENGLNIQNSLMNFLDFNGMLPTPIASDIHHAERVQKLKESGAETMASRKNGASRPNGLMDYLDFSGMLPTPTRSDFSTRGDQPNWDGRDLVSTMHKATFQTGKTSQLNPRFVWRDDGLSPELVGITVSKHRNESIKAAGNAIVPQVVYQIFKAINEYREKYP